MKKFSIAGVVFALGAAACSVAFAQSAPDAKPATDAKPAADAKTAGSRKPVERGMSADAKIGAEFKSLKGKCEFRTDAPDKHTVVRTDTLWDISGKFLRNPWCWPEVWGLNTNQIRDPHWIYPGQIVYFDRAAGRLRLGNATGALGDGKLSPRVRIEAMGRDAIPAIPTSAIEPFLTQPLIVGENELVWAPRIVAVQETRIMLGKGDKAYAVGELKGSTSFQAFRPAKPLRDPLTKEILAYEAVYLGNLSLDRAGQTPDEAHRFIVSLSKEEMGIGDRLVPVPPTPIMNYIPHAPSSPVEARIVSIYGGVGQAGQNNVVTLNRGRNHGLDIGTVLQLYRYRGSIVDRTAPAEKDLFGNTHHSAIIKLPDEQYGNLFVFRVFDQISYALVMQVSDVVQVADIARSPE